MADTGEHGAARFVLPRWLRRPVRVVARLAGGDVEVSRYASLVCNAALISGFALYGGYLGGHLPAFAQAVTARTGLAVDSIHINGNRETSELDILDQLQLDGWTSLVGYDVDQARDRIASLPWIEAASVRKVYPDTLDVRIQEKIPFALWQQGLEIKVIQQDGKVIAAFAGGRHAALPLVIGSGAADEAAAFVSRVKQLPELAARVKGYIRIAERRWDLRLENGITVRLPEAGEDAALIELAAFDHENALLARDITAVDLRLADRLVVQLTPEAVLRREAALKDAAKAAKKLGRKT